MAQQFTCDTCGLTVSADDREEVVRLIRDHAQNAHSTSVAGDVIRAEMTEAEAGD